jgi:hypothetical protein
MQGDAIALSNATFDQSTRQALGMQRQALISPPVIAIDEGYAIWIDSDLKM